MNFSKAIYLIFSIIFALCSVVLYTSSMFISTYDTDWGSILVLLNPAKVMFIFSIVFLILFIILYFSEKQNKAKILYKVFACVLCLGLVLSALFAAVGYKSERLYWINEDEKDQYTQIEKYLPYNDLFQSSDSSEIIYQVSKLSAGSGIKHNMSFNLIKDSTCYEAEYFKSRDIFLNLKFITDRTVPSIFNDGFIDVEAEPVAGEKDGISYNLYVEEDRYSLAIGDKSHAFYAELIDIGSLNISAEEFAETAIEQYRIMQKSAELDIYTF